MLEPDSERTRTDEPEPTAVAAFDVAPELFPAGGADRSGRPDDRPATDRARRA